MRRHLAVRADHGRPVERARRFVGPRLARLLARHPPAAGFLRLRRILDVEDHEDAAVEAFGRRGEISVAAAGIGIAVGAVGIGPPVRDHLRVDRIADVPDQHALIVRPFLIEAPPDRRLLQRRHQDIAVRRHLDGPGVGRPGNVLHEGRIFRIGDVDDGPAAVPEMAEIHVPAAVRCLLQRHLEGAAPVLERRVADRRHVAGFEALRDRVGVRGARKSGQRDRERCVECRVENGAAPPHLAHEILPTSF